MSILHQTTLPSVANVGVRAILRLVKAVKQLVLRGHSISAREWFGVRE